MFPCNLGDYNPFVSPPAYFLSEKFSVLQFYLETRVHRKKTFMDLLEEEVSMLHTYTNIYIHIQYIYMHDGG